MKWINLLQKITLKNLTEFFSEKIIPFYYFFSILDHPSNTTHF